MEMEIPYNPTLTDTNIYGKIKKTCFRLQLLTVRLGRSYYVTVEGVIVQSSQQQNKKDYYCEDVTTNTINSQRFACIAPYLIVIVIAFTLVENYDWTELRIELRILSALREIHVIIVGFYTRQFIISFV